MNFTDYEKKLLDTKPRNLSDEEKVIRRSCIRKIEYQKIKEQIKKDRKEYHQTPEGYKKLIKRSWKSKGLNMENFEEIFKRYCDTTNCNNCNCILTKDKRITSTTKCMIHNHQTGEFKNILCHFCNVRKK